MIKVSYSSWAWEDLRSAVKYYAEQSSTIAFAFLEEIDAALELISDSPKIGAPISGGNRRLILQRFPYVMIYRVEIDRVFILAIAHQRQHPHFWKDR